MTMQITTEEYEQLIRSFAATVAKEYIRLYNQKPNIAWVERFCTNMADEMISSSNVKLKLVDKLRRG